MAFKDTILYSVVNNKCPRCHEGNFFETNNPYMLNRFDKMHKNCPVCKEDFERETGFYYGAMYVSYGLTVAFGVAIFLLTSVILGYDAVTFLVAFGVLQIILMPVFYRMARLVWINLFVSYKDKERKKS
ncbi:MAG: DUF983 domain-containing protein [Bacteroidia bacterium]|nr:DUF983 domain-containing protein [Bacteroidia bacterium]